MRRRVSNGRRHLIHSPRSASPRAKSTELWMYGHGPASHRHGHPRPGSGLGGGVPMRRRTRTTWIFGGIACAIAALAAGGCGDDDSAKTGSPTAAAASATIAPAATPTAAPPTAIPSPTTGPTTNGVPIVKQIPAADLNKLTLPAAPQAILKIAPVQLNGVGTAMPGLLLSPDATIYAPLGGTFVSAETGASQQVPSRAITATKRPMGRSSISSFLGRARW